MTIEEKYGIVYKKVHKPNSNILVYERFYLVDLTKKNYDFIGSTPRFFTIDKIEIETGKSWGCLLENLCNYLIKNYNALESSLLNIELDFTSRKLFSKENGGNGTRLLENGLYIRCTFNAEQLVFVIQTLLNLFHVKECTLFIKRNEEKEEVCNYYKEKMQEYFRDFLNSHYSIEDTNKMVSFFSSVDVIYKRIKRNTKASIYLNDQFIYFGTIKKDIIVYAKNNMIMNDKQIVYFDKLYDKYVCCFNKIVKEA